MFLGQGVFIPENGAGPAELTASSPTNSTAPSDPRGVFYSATPVRHLPGLAMAFHGNDNLACMGGRRSVRAEDGLYRSFHNELVDRFIADEAVRMCDHVRLAKKCTHQFPSSHGLGTQTLPLGS